MIFIFIAAFAVLQAIDIFAQTTGQSTNDIIYILSRGSGPAVLSVIVVGAIREWWVPGATHRRMVDERNELLRLAIRSQKTTERTVRIAEQAIDIGDSNDRMG
jgi:hypothetical protein